MPGTVGAFPGIASHFNRTTRADVNPYDKSTVVSIFPKAIDETNHTISPGRFKLAPGTYENPSLLIIGPSSWWKFIDDQQPILEIPCGSHQIANSLVRDYCNGLVGCNMTNSMPGIFWLPGELSAEDVKTKHPDALRKAKEKQDMFWKALVKLADSFWARTNGNPLSINDEMRMAAREMNLTGKDWMKDFTMMQMVNCKACGSPVKPGYPVCSNCHAIVNETQAKELGIKFASL